MDDESKKRETKDRKAREEVVIVQMYVGENLSWKQVRSVWKTELGPGWDSTQYVIVWQFAHLSPLLDCKKSEGRDCLSLLSPLP